MRRVAALAAVLVVTAGCVATAAAPAATTTGASSPPAAPGIPTASAGPNRGAAAPATRRSTETVTAPLFRYYSVTGRSILPIAE
jgi:hypothetical protein